MGRVGLNYMVRRLTALGTAVVLTALLAACAKVEIPPYLRPLSKDTVMLLGKKGMTTESPIFIRVFKEESELEVWKQRQDGRFYHFKTYPICNWSGDLGPKIRQGDRQAPEGFYRINQRQLNPNSNFHLAFNLGYPNAFDRANRRTGDFLMIHGKCKSAGCYAMTDALIEEIYALARESLISGQEEIHVHAFPFRLTAENLERHKKSPHYKFWLTLRQGYDFFETSRQVPSVAVCERRYVVNVRYYGDQRIRPDGACPAFEREQPVPFVPLDGTRTAEQVVVSGTRMRTAAKSSSGGSTVLGGFSSALGFGSSSSSGSSMLGFSR